MVGSISIPVCLWYRLICRKYGGRKCENIYQTSLQWIFTHLPMRAWICWLWYCQHQSQGRNSNKCRFSFDVSLALAQLLFDLSSKQVFSCVWFPLWGLFSSASSQTPLPMFWIRHSKCRVCESGLASPLDNFVVCQPRSTILITRLCPSQSRISIPFPTACISTRSQGLLGTLKFSGTGLCPYS